MALKRSHMWSQPGLNHHYDSYTDYIMELNKIEGGCFHMAWYAFVFTTFEPIVWFWFSLRKAHHVLKIWQIRNDFVSNLPIFWNAEQKIHHVSHLGSSFWRFDPWYIPAVTYIQSQTQLVSPNRNHYTFVTHKWWDFWHLNTSLTSDFALPVTDSLAA